jgi:hypothetical protein
MATRKAQSARHANIVLATLSFNRPSAASPSAKMTAACGLRSWLMTSVGSTTMAVLTLGWPMRFSCNGKMFWAGAKERAGRMKIARKFAVVLLVVAAAWFIYAWIWPRRYGNLAAQIHVGDDRARVHAVLGAATETTTSDGGFLSSLFFPHEVWFYGDTFEWGTPISTDFLWVLCPVRPKFRLFKPDQGDVAVYFNSSGKVTRVEVSP